MFEVQIPDYASPESRIRLPRPPQAKDPSLNFFSMEFDALVALRAPEVRRPNELVAPLNNLAQCKFILPKEMEESLSHLQQLSTKTKVLSIFSDAVLTEQDFHTSKNDTF